MKTTGLYLGSFDPVTYGHIDIITRSANLFQNVIVGVSDNMLKTYMFSKDERIALVKRAVSHLPNVSVLNIQDGRLSCDIGFEYNATLIRGIRNQTDAEYENFVGTAWKLHHPSVDIVVLTASNELKDISSSSAKIAAQLNGKTQHYVPLFVKEAMERKLGQFRIGVTGSIASGKSTLVNDLVRLYPTRIKNLCLDTIASDILFERTEPAYSLLREEIIDKFEIYRLTKPNIASVIFKNEDQKNWLNDKIMPFIETRIRAEIGSFKGLIIFNSALLIDRNMLDYVNNNLVLLEVSEEEQLKRLQERGHTNAQSVYRITSQLSTERKAERVMKKIQKDNTGLMLSLGESDNRAKTVINFVYNNLKYCI